MKLNLKVEIESKFDEELDWNSVSVATNTTNTVQEVLTVLKIAENNLKEAISEKVKREEIKEVTEEWLKSLTIEDLYNGS